MMTQETSELISRGMAVMQTQFEGLKDVNLGGAFSGLSNVSEESAPLVVEGMKDARESLGMPRDLPAFSHLG